MQGNFFHGDGVLAVLCSIVQTADATPDDFLFSADIPCDTLVAAATFGAVQHLAQRVFGVFPTLGNRRLIRFWSEGLSPRQFFLCAVENVAADDRRVAVLDKVHRRFSVIRFSRFGDAVDRNGFLEDAVTTVFFVPQDIHDHVLAEAEILSGELNFLRLQRLRDHLDRLTGEEHLVDPLHDGCFFRHDLRLLIFAFSVAKEILVLKAHFPFFKLLTVGPCDMLADTTKIDLFAYLWQLPCALCSLILMTLTVWATPANTRPRRVLLPAKPRSIESPSCASL